MDKIDIVIGKMLECFSARALMPVVYAREEGHRPMKTTRRALLEMIMVTRGRIRIGVGGLEAEFVAGEAALVNAHFGNEGLEFSADAGYACVSFDIGDIAELKEAGQSPLLETGVIAEREEMFRLYRRMERAHSAPATRFKGYRLKGETLLFLSGFAESIRPPALLSRGGGIDHASLAVDYIQSCFDEEDLTLARIATSIRITPEHLCRLFKRKFGLTPMHYLEQLRITSAADLLDRTGQDIKAISYAVGYADQLYFSRVFRKLKGVSPLQYRRRSG